MAQQASAAIENNFTKGLLTEFTGLNFPENAATDTDNCTYSLIGDVTRREGIDLEINSTSAVVSVVGKALSSYSWNNVGGDGVTQIVVEQVGPTLYFYKSSSATVAAPLSTTILVSTVNLNDFIVLGTSQPTGNLECQYADGNGYLFVYHPACDPIYCTYNTGTITGNRITVQIRDFSGVYENTSLGLRPTNLTTAHSYNLVNQGWVTGNSWSADSSTAFSVAAGSVAFTVPAGITGVTNGTRVKIDNTIPGSLPGTAPAGATFALGTVTSYAGATLTINIDTVISPYSGYPATGELIYPIGTGYLSTWNTAVGNYPSNSDVWWYFKNAAGTFNPATTLNNVSLSIGNAPRGHFIIDAFNQQREAVSNVVGVTPITTTVRPKTGCWFQGRVWYAGVDAQQPATGNAAYYTWTESIYFSQIIKDSTSFGNCYQINDPTSDTLFDELPTDGGVITIQGCGSIYKLFPMQNGLLVFAANGIWFIAGSQGAGFSANDYAIIKLSSIKNISGTSYVDVMGMPYFWNEDGIYSVKPPQQQGFGFSVASVTYSTIDTFYAEIPMSCKKLARGAYDPINYVIQWTYRDTQSDDITESYQFNKILNLNTQSQAFYPYTLGVSSAHVHGVSYVTHPGGVTAPSPTFKYFTSYVSGAERCSFADKHDNNYVDWASLGSVNYDSYFITGYGLKSKALTKFQPTYVYMFSRNDTETSYKIQSIWDYADDRNSGRWSSFQRIDISQPNYAMVFRRHKLRGHGLVFQIKITSVAGRPFDIMGWSMPLQINASV